jgi:hypothetical protein
MVALRPSGVMRIDFPNQKSWPKFARYIREDFPKLTLNIPIKLALKKWGKLCDSDIFSTLSWGTGPQIIISDPIGIDDFPHTICLGMSAVSQFEVDSSVAPLPRTKNAHGRLVYGVGVSILMQIVAGNVRFIEKKSAHPKSSGTIDVMEIDATAGFQSDVYGSLTDTI